MTIQSVADKIYQAAQTLLDDRIQNLEYKQTLLAQLHDYYNYEHKDEMYVRNLQFMYDHWCRTLPISKSPPPKKSVRFYNPIDK
jgi:hypothetical protein